MLIVPALIVGLLTRPPRDARAPEAHAVRRARPHRAQRGRARSCGRRTRPRRSACSSSCSPVCCRARRAGADQPGLALRPVRPVRGEPGSQPDWYIGWLEGALRLMPPWEIRICGFEIPNPFFPGVLLPGITFRLLYAWPFLEARFTRDHAEHHLLDRPRDRPVRTATRRRGAGVLRRAVLRRRQRRHRRARSTSR